MYKLFLACRPYIQKTGGKLDLAYRPYVLAPGMRKGYCFKCYRIKSPEIPVFV